MLRTLRGRRFPRTFLVREACESMSLNAEGSFSRPYQRKGERLCSSTSGAQNAQNGPCGEHKEAAGECARPQAVHIMQIFRRPRRMRRFLWGGADVFDVKRPA